MGVFDRVAVGVDGTDFGFEALHQTLALSPVGASVRAVTALDTSIAVHAGFHMEHFVAQFEAEAERARATATEIMGDRPNCTTKVVRGDAKSVCDTAATSTTPGDTGGRGVTMPGTSEIHAASVSLRGRVARISAAPADASDNVGDEIPGD
jgi:hypothetical protein